MRRGDTVPDFTLKDQEGRDRSLGEFAARGPVVLFFYPAALTSGCTREACHFRDRAADFEALGAQRLGVSLDPVARQHLFDESNHLGYPLLADERGELARLFGVKRALGPLKVRRTTFVLDEERRVLAVIASEVRMHEHADRALEALRARTA